MELSTQTLPPEAAPVVAWLASEAPALEDPAVLIAALCARLREVDVQVDRMTVGLQILHPLVRVVSWTWRSDRPAVECREFDINIESRPVFLSSPIAELRRGTPVIRRRMTGPEAQLDYPILHDLLEQGFTEYLALAFRFDQGQANALTWSTRRPGGFSPLELQVLAGLRPLLSLLMEVHAQRRLSRTILGTYLGREAGEQVLRGRIHRGDGATIHAVIWTSDIRGFTALSDRLGRPEVLELLNGAFEAQVRAVQSQGGEVLKFMGDGLLAVFRAGETPAEASAAVEAALEAARLAFGGLAALNHERTGRGLDPVDVGLALHLGEVEFGNIGAPDRLDFTVIGPAVNQASRMEGLCRPLGQRLILSAEVAAHVAEPTRWGLRALGPHPLRGVPEPVALYTAGLPPLTEPRPEASP